jgi:hypothetical protein
MDSADRYVRKNRGSQGGNDVTLLRCHLFPYCIGGARVMTKEGKGLLEGNGVITVVLSYQEDGISCMQSFKHFVFVSNCEFVYRVFILSVEERLHIIIEVADKYVPPQKNRCGIWCFIVNLKYETKW